MVCGAGVEERCTVTAWNGESKRVREFMARIRVLVLKINKFQMTSTVLTRYVDHSNLLLNLIFDFQ